MGLLSVIMYSCPASTAKQGQSPGAQRLEASDRCQLWHAASPWVAGGVDPRCYRIRGPSLVEHHNC